MKKIINYFFCFITIFSCLCSSVFATEGVGISTYANNTSSASTNFTIDSNGVANVRVSYYGIDNVTTHAVITIKIQKRFLLVFWQDVDGASWTDYATGEYYINSHSVSVKSGTYRVQVEYVIYGSGGEADTITDTIEATY